MFPIKYNDFLRLLDLDFDRVIQRGPMSGIGMCKEDTTIMYHTFLLMFLKRKT